MSFEANSTFLNIYFFRLPINRRFAVQLFRVLGF